MKIVDLVQGSSEWLAFRRNGVGGSDIAAIMGRSPYKTRQRLLKEKYEGETPINEFTQEMFNRGHEFEQRVRESMALDGSLYTPFVCVSDETDRLFCSLDGLSEDNQSILEIKHVNSESSLDDLSKRQHWFDQCQWNMLISGTKKCTLIYGTAIDNCRFIELEANDYAQQELLARAKEFLRDLDQQIAASREISTSETGVSVIQQISELVTKRKQLEAAAAEYEKQAKELAEAFLTQHNTSRISVDGLVIEKQTKAGNIDYSAIPELEGINLEKYRKKPSTSIRITLK